MFPKVALPVIISYHRKHHAWETSNFSQFKYFLSSFCFCPCFQEARDFYRFCFVLRNDVITLRFETATQCRRCVIEISRLEYFAVTIKMARRSIVTMVFRSKKWTSIVHTSLRNLYLPRNRYRVCEIDTVQMHVLKSLYILSVYWPRYCHWMSSTFQNRIFQSIYFSPCVLVSTIGKLKSPVLKLTRPIHVFLITRPNVKRYFMDLFMLCRVLSILEW